MKRLLLFAVVLFIALPGTAQVATVRPKKVKPNFNGNASLTVITPRNQSYRFWLYIDDVLQNEQSVRSIRVNQLEEDSYYVRVELDNELQNCVGQFVDLRQSKDYAVVRAEKWFGIESTSINIRPEQTVNLKTSKTEPEVVPPTAPTPKSTTTTMQKNSIIFSINFFILSETYIDELSSVKHTEQQYKTEQTHIYSPPNWFLIYKL